MSARRIQAVCGALLVALLMFGLLSLWVSARWTWTVFQTGVFTTAILWLSAVLAGKVRWRIHWMTFPLAACVAWIGFQCAAGWTAYRFATVESLLTWLTYLVVFLLASAVFDDSSLRHRARQSMLWFGFAVSVVSVTQLFTSEGRAFWLFQSEFPALLGPFVNRDHFASFMALILPIAVWQIFQDRRRGPLYTAMTAAIVAAVVASASRGGFLLVGLELAILTLPVVLGRRAGARQAAGLMLRVLLFVAVFGAVVGWGVLWDKFQDSDPYRTRRELLNSSLTMIQERPVKGFGMGTWPHVYPAYATIDIGFFMNHAHNDWVEWTVEGGIPFTVSLAVFVAAAGYLACRRAPWAVGAVAVFVHSMVDFPMQRSALGAWVFALTGVLVGACFPRGNGGTLHSSSDRTVELLGVRLRQS